MAIPSRPMDPQSCLAAAKPPVGACARLRTLESTAYTRFGHWHMHPGEPTHTQQTWQAFSFL